MLPKGLECQNCVTSHLQQQVHTCVGSSVLAAHRLETKKMVRFLGNWGPLIRLTEEGPCTNQP
jgi:hypothetical protein